jgi:hypothetical protein
VTNNFGFYSLSIPKSSGKVEISYSYVGYTTQTIPFRR